MINKKVILKMTGRIVAGICLVCMVVPGGHVNAEESQKKIVREATGDAEELAAYQLPEDMEDKIPAATSYRYSARNISDPDVKEFLDYGTDYGYQDMTKRSNSEARQFLYETLDDMCKAFTAGGWDAEPITLSGEIFWGVGKTTQSKWELTDNELAEIYFTFRNDNPQYFWLDNAVLWTTDDNLVICTYEAYRNSADRENALEEIMGTMETVYESKVSDSDSAYKKTLKIHDALIADIEYEDSEIAHSIAGAMTSEKLAVCEGYAKVMQLMLNRYDVPNVYVTGDSEGEGHAWNMVCMNDGKYYWLDATWDDQPYEEIQHDWFLVGNDNFPYHTADTPAGAGVEFLYALPTVSDADYVYDPSLDGIKGDINKDGKVDIKDLTLCINHVSKKQILTGDVFIIADVNGDGDVTIKDVMKYVSYVSKKTNEL